MQDHALQECELDGSARLGILPKRDSVPSGAVQALLPMALLHRHPRDF